jgi:hypothetical protein
MQAVDAELVQDDQIVARATALFLRRREHPQPQPWTTPIAMPLAPPDKEQWSKTRPMFITCYGRNPVVGGDGSEWRHLGPKYAWVREIRPLVDHEPLTPFVRAAMAVDLTSSLTHFSAQGLQYINADYTLTLSRLPERDFIGLAALTHYGNAGVATGTATLFDHLGPIGTGLSTAVANATFQVPQAFSELEEMGSAGACQFVAREPCTPSTMRRRAESRNAVTSRRNPAGLPCTTSPYVPLISKPHCGSTETA